MARYLTVIDVPVAPEVAFDYLADFSRVAEWDPSVREAARLGDGPPAQGSEFEVTTEFLGQRLELVYQLTACEAPHYLALRAESAGFVSRDEITLAPVGHGTRITYDARIELKGVRALTEPVVNAAFQWIGRGAARGLREQLSRNAPVHPDAATGPVAAAG